MKLFTKMTLALVFAASILPVSASAQSTCSSASDLRACEHSSLVDCRSTWGCADDRAEATSVTDVVVDAAASCCSKPTRKANSCLKKAGRQLSQAAQKAPSFARRLFRQARNEVLALRTNGCDTGTLGDL